MDEPEFSVNGTGLPEVHFDVGESYAGTLPISSDPNEQSSLFFWFFPTANPNPRNDIVIWLNGGVRPNVSLVLREKALT